MRLLCGRSFAHKSVWVSEEQAARMAALAEPLIGLLRFPRLTILRSVFAFLFLVPSFLRVAP